MNNTAGQSHRSFDADSLEKIQISRLFLLSFSFTRLSGASDRRPARSAGIKAGIVDLPIGSKATLPPAPLAARAITFV
jgi:hypothetical protein